MVKKVHWLATLIVSIFAGSFGIDRFMMGHYTLGILKLITFGGLGIWWFIDLLLIAIQYDFEGVEWVYRY